MKGRVTAIALFLLLFACTPQGTRGEGSLAQGQGRDSTSLSSASITFALPAEDDPYPIPTATFVLGDLREELKAENTNFVTDFATTAEMPFIRLGLPAGLPFRMEGDAVAASVVIYDGYPEGDSIAEYELKEGLGSLPDEPGEFYLRVRGSWSGGRWTEYFTGINVVEPGAAQFVLDEEGDTRKVTAELWIDGQRVEATTLGRTKTEGNDVVESSGPPVSSGPLEFLPVRAGAPLHVLGHPTELSAFLDGPQWEDANSAGTPFPLYGPGARIPAEPGRHLLVLDAAWEDRLDSNGEFDPDGELIRQDIRVAFPVVIGDNEVPTPDPLPTGPIFVGLDTSEALTFPKASAVFGGRVYIPVRTSLRYTIEAEVFESSYQYRDAASVAGATLIVPPGTSIRFEGTQDRVLAAWANAPLEPVSSLAVPGSPGEASVLRFRGEWDPGSFVQWELYFQLESR